MVTDRHLRRQEIDLVWSIDRTEVIDSVYHLRNGELVLEPERYDMRGWPPGEAETYTPLLEDCFDRGGWFHGLFDGDVLLGVAVLDSRRLGPTGDMLQLKFLHVSHDHRGQGLGRQLFDLASTEARSRGAARLYVSATPSQSTIDFYRRLGCTPTADVDDELYALEPEDIHLECAL